VQVPESGERRCFAQLTQAQACTGPSGFCQRMFPLSAKG
jgi:hypothetical protein